MVVKILRTATLCLAALALVLGAIGCGSSSSEDSTQPFVAPALDMVAVSPNDNRLLIFRDVARKSFGSVAEVVLDESTSSVDRPTGVFVANNRLFVTSVDDGKVQIFNDFAGLTSGAIADVELTGLYRPYRVFVNGNSLYVAAENEVYIYRDIPTLATGDAPDAAVNDGVDSAKDVVVGGDVLYVANYDGDTVTCYQGAESLTGNPSVDMTLDTNGSLIREPIRLTYHANALYVANRDQAVYIYRNIASATDGQAPDTVLGGPSDLEGVRRPLVDDYRLYVPNRYAYYPDDEPGFSIFDEPTTVTNGQVADVELLHEDVQRCTAADLHSNVLVGFSDEDNVFFVYLQANEIVENQDPDFLLWDPRFTNNRVAEIFLIAR